VSRLRLFLALLGILLSAAAIYLLVRSIDVRAAIDALGTASPAWLLASFATTVLVYYARTLRWGALLELHARPSTSSLFRANMVGFLAVNTLPARLGELVRAYLLARKERISTATVLGSVAVERILDLGFMGIFWALSLLFAPVPAWFRWSGIVTLAVTGLIATVLWSVQASRTSHRGWAVKLRARLPHFVRERFSTAASAFGTGLQVLSHPRLLGQAVAWSVALWLLSGSVFLMVGKSLGMGLPAWSMFLLTFVVCVGISLPSSPGFIGIMEWACVLGLSLVGFEGPQALAFAILYHLTQIAPLLVLGTYFAVREHVTPGRLRALMGSEEGGGRKK
jgi:glycosyltransferase 2 family protein